MFEIVSENHKPRLEADAALTELDFRAVAGQLGTPAVRARKISYVAARQAESEQVIDTRWNGKETTNIAHPGDWIVTNLSPERKVLIDGEGNENTYVIAADRFADLYEPAEEDGRVYRAKGVVEAIAVRGGFDIVAPWGERQMAPAGYLMFNGREVYGCHAEIFAATYEVVPA